MICVPNNHTSIEPTKSNNQSSSVSNHKENIGHNDTIDSQTEQNIQQIDLYIADMETKQTIPHLPRRSTRTRRAPLHLQEFICQQATSFTPLQNLNKAEDSIPLGTPYPLSDNVSYDSLSIRHRAFITSITSQIEPKNY